MGKKAFIMNRAMMDTTVARTNFSFRIHGAQFFGELRGLFPQARDLGPLRFEEGDDDQPDGEDHEQPQGGHVPDQLEEADILGR